MNGGWRVRANIIKRTVIPHFLEPQARRITVRGKKKSRMKTYRTRICCSWGVNSPMVVALSMFQ